MLTNFAAHIVLLSIHFTLSLSGHTNSPRHLHTELCDVGTAILEVTLEGVQLRQCILHLGARHLYHAVLDHYMNMDLYILGVYILELHRSPYGACEVVQSTVRSSAVTSKER